MRGACPRAVRGQMAIFTTANRTAVSWLQHFFDVGNCLPLPSAIARRSDLIQLGAFRASLVQLGDFDLWIRLAALGEFFVLPEQLTKIRIIEGTNLPSTVPPRATPLTNRACDGAGTVYGISYS